MSTPPICDLRRILRYLALLLLAQLVPIAAAEEPKRVLIVESFGRDVSPDNAIGSTLRAELTALTPRPLVIHDVSLDVERRGAPDDERLFVGRVPSRGVSPQPGEG